MGRSVEITNTEDIIDSRDVIKRINYLTDTEDEDEAEELRLLVALQSAVGDSYDWSHGATLIRDSHFEDYVRDIAEDLHGSELRNASWPFDHIDWASAADALKADYTSVDFDDVTYWVRS